MTDTEIINQMIQLIKAETGQTLTQAKKATIIVNECGTNLGETKFSTFSLCYVGNPYFCGGKANDMGAGWYFKAKFVIGCGVRYLKIK